MVVLDGDWARVGRGEEADPPRRLYYVAMTRAMQTLTLMRLPGPHPFQDALSADLATFSGAPRQRHRHRFREAGPQLPQVRPGPRFSQFCRIPASRTSGSRRNRRPLARRPPGCEGRARALGAPGPERHGGRPAGTHFQTSARYALRIPRGHGHGQVGPGALRAAVPGKPALRFLGGDGA